jgi:hypothetical protein
MGRLQEEIPKASSVAARSGPGRSRAGFRPDPTRATGAVPSRGQAVALVAVLLVVAGAVAAASFLARPDRARAFDLFYGSVYLDDTTAPVAVDLASGKPTVQLVNAFNEVSAKASDQLHVVPLTGGTLLLNTATGEFNMLDATGFVLKGVGGGVQVPPLTGSHAAAVASGDSAYIVQSSADQTAVYLVGQPTVAAAAGSHGTARARATYGVDQGSADAGTTAAAADGDLWLLTGPAQRRTIRQLHVPAGSNAGVPLAATEHGTVSGAAAVASATGSDRSSVAVASAAGIDVFAPGTTSRHVPLPGLAGLDRVLPAHQQTGRFSFLLHDAAGWAVATVDTDGGNALVRRIPAIPARARLIAPGASDGALYTMDAASGRLWRIGVRGDAAPVPGRGVYPITPLETLAHFDGADVLARGARVIFNAPQHDLALTVFTDGSAAPVVVDKRSAIRVSPNGPALSGLHADRPGTPKPSQPPPTGTPKPQTPVNEKIDCTRVSQVPHAPLPQLDERGSRSVRLSWTYPHTAQDCLPSTYTVGVQLVSGDAPAPPATVTVQGSDGVAITGLFPDTQYQFVVSAYLNGRGTPSQPLPVRTSVEGPAAPTGVHVTTDAAGNWHVTWNSCGGAPNGCVPSVQWRLVPQVCGDSPGLVGAPATAGVVGDPTLRSFSYSYNGGPGLLGRGLSFVVEGVGERGTIGDPSDASPCEYSWADPRPDAITVTASTPPDVTGGQSAATTVHVAFSGDPDVALGGVGGQLTYQLLSGDAVVSETGPTGDTTVSLGGILPGQLYRVRVIVSPPRHADAAVSLPTVPVQAAISDWPGLSLTAGFDAAGDPLGGTLTVQVAGLASSDARGEKFDLSGAQLRCGNAAMDLAQNDFDPAAPLHFDVPRLQYYGSCTVSLQLVEDPASYSPPAYFGGTPSPAITAAVTIPPPTVTTTSFTATWVASPTAQVSVAAAQDPAWLLSSNWAITVHAPDGTACGSATSALGAPTFPVTIAVDNGCLAQLDTQQGWSVEVSYQQLGRPSSQTVNITGTAPAPVFLTAADFSAAWSADGAAVTLTYTGTRNLAGQTSGWTEYVREPTDTATCGSASSAPTPEGLVIAVAYSDSCPGGAQGWLVRVRYSDATAGPQGPIDVPIRDPRPPAPPPSTSSPPPSPTPAPSPS